MITDTENQRISQLLKQFRCNEREAKIYLHCLRNGPATVQEIAKQMKQNRVTVHSAATQMIEKGILYESRKGKRRLVGAESPEIFHALVQKKENELNLLKTNLDYVIEKLSNVEQTDPSVPTVKFYEGVEGFKKMLEESLEAKRRIYVFTYVDLFSKLLDPEYLEDYFRRRAAKGISTQLIFPPCPFAERVNKKAEEYKIEIRTLPKEWKWKAGFFLWDDMVALKSFTEGKITCTMVRNKDISYFLKEVVFRMCWEMANKT